MLWGKGKTVTCAESIVAIVQTDQHHCHTILAIIRQKINQYLLSGVFPVLLPLGLVLTVLLSIEKGSALYGSRYCSLRKTMKYLSQGMLEGQVGVHHIVCKGTLIRESF